MKITDVFQFANCEDVTAIVAIRHLRKQPIGSEFSVSCYHKAKAHVVQCLLLNQFHSPTEQITILVGVSSVIEEQ